MASSTQSVQSADEGDNLNEAAEGGKQMVVDLKVDEGGLLAQHEGDQQQDTTATVSKSFMMSLSNVNEEEEVYDEQDELQRGASEVSIDDFSGTLESAINDNPYPGSSSSLRSTGMTTMVQPSELQHSSNISIRRARVGGGLGSSLVQAGGNNHGGTNSSSWQRSSVQQVHLPGGNWRRGSVFDIGHGSQHHHAPTREHNNRDVKHHQAAAQRGSLIFDSDPRRRGSSLLAFRPRHHNHDNNNNNNNNNKKVNNGTELTNGSDDDDEEEGSVSSTTVTTNPSTSSIGSLLMDTYSFMYIYPICSAPYLYALFFFVFQFVVYALLLTSLLDWDNSSNVLHVPSNISNGMRVAQGCAILIAVMNSVDVMVSLNNLLRTPDLIIVVNDYDGDNVDDELNEVSRGLLDNSSSNITGGGGEGGGSRHDSSVGGGASRHNSNELLGIQRGLAHGRSDISMRVQPLEVPCTAYPAGFKFKLANVLRGIEGSLSVMASFILIIQSSEIVAMFQNFAALEFVVNLDNLAFAIAEHGMVSDRLQDAARFVGGLGYLYTDKNSVNNNGNNRRTRKKSKGQGSCSPGRFAHLRSSFITRIFSCVCFSPLRYVKSHPDGTRRTTLFVMAATLYGCWAYILSGLSQGDYLCKSFDIDFFHAHAETSTIEEADAGIKPYLASRSGLYVAIIPQEKTDDDQQSSVYDSFVSIFNTSKNKLFISYRKADPKAFPGAESTFQPTARIPVEYVEIVYYDTEMKRWIFTSCSPETYNLRDVNGRVCKGPRILSAETNLVDFASLSTLEEFHIVSDEEGLFDTTLSLPAIITCNECGRPEITSAAGGGGPGVPTCGMSGGVCSPPQEEYGFRRQCTCPVGLYGPFCDEHYGTTCSTLEMIRLEGAELKQWESKDFIPRTDQDFTLVQDQMGPGNTPIWQRHYADLGYTDSLEWHGAHWTITRHQDPVKISYTLAIANGASAMDGVVSTTGGAKNGVASLLNAQPQPAGLLFYAPKSAAWGTQPDYERPFANFQVRCKAATV